MGCLSDFRVFDNKVRLKSQFYLGVVVPSEKAHVLL